jgi:hypothetical protein
MAGISQDISIQVNNSLDRKATVTLLGGTQDPSNGQANAKTLYEWDLSAESFSNTTVVEIEASTVANPEVISFRAVNQDGEITSLETVVSLLNTLNLGTFNLDGTTIFILDDINVFGGLSVRISQDFDIDTFVESGYNYFDPESKTTLVDFSTKFKPLIQEAVNTIPTFVEFIETQGWSLAYVVEAEQVIFNRTVSGDLFVITDIGGNLNTNTITDKKYDSGINVTLNKALIFVNDIQIFKGIQFLSLKANNTGESYIYKNVFTGNVTFSPERNNLFGWIPLSSLYIPKNSDGFKETTIFLAENGITDIYGNSFPSVQLADGEVISFEGALPSFNLGGAGVDANISFNEFDGSFNFAIKEVQSINNNFDFNFNTLILENTKFLNSFFSFLFSELSQPTVTLDSSFNTKFQKFSKLSDNLSQFTLAVFDTGVDSNQAIISFDDITTPLVINSDLINFRRNYFVNLPPISQLGGYASNTEYNLLLLLLNQGEPTNISMRYFNDWFHKIGTQDAVYDEAITSGTRLVNANSNTFLLSGRGLQGYYSLAENGYTVTLPTGAILSNTISFTIIADPFNTKLTGIRMTSFFGLGNPTFEVKTSEKGQNDSVISSTSVAVGFELLQFPNNNEDVDVIMTSFPTVSTNTVLIGETSSSYDQFKRMYIGQGLFQFPLQNLDFTVLGLTLTMPIYDAVANEVDAIGLYQRNFNGAWGGTNATFTLAKFKINGTKIGNPSIQPFNSSAIINLTAYTSNFPNIEFDNCIFGTDLVDDTLNNILNLLLPSSAFAPNGIKFQNCQFNGVDNSNPYLQVTFPLGSQNVNSQALNGTSQISGVTFSQSQPDRILFTSNWDGNPTASPLNLLLVGSNTNLEQINLQNSNTATPNALTLNIVSNSALEVLNFTNHNITNLLFSNNPLINNIDLSGNDLPDAEIDDLLNEVNSYGTSNGTINYSSQTGGGVPTAVGSGTAYNNLISRGWTLTGASPFGTNISTYTVNQTQSFARPTVYDWEFNEAGDLLFIFAGANYEKYPLTTPFDISTIGAISQSVAWNSSPSFFGFGAQVWDNGNYLFMSIGGLLRRWTFGTPNDLTTVSSLATVVQSPNFGLTTLFTFNPSGTKYYNLTGLGIDEYTLSTAWNPTTLTFSASKSYVNMGLTSIPISSSQRRLSLRFDSSGTLAIITMGQSASPFNALVYEMNLSIAFDISTMTYSGNSLDISDKPNEWVNKVGADSNLTKIIPLYLQTGGYPTNSTELKEWS